MPDIPPLGTLSDTARFWLEPAFMAGSEDLPWTQRVWAVCLTSPFDCQGSDSLISVLPDLDFACDAHLIETVLRNLLYNATRYASQRIHVSFGVVADRYRLHVEDDHRRVRLSPRQRARQRPKRVGG